MKAVMNHPGNDSIKNQAYVHFWTVIFVFGLCGLYLNII